MQNVELAEKVLYRIRVNPDEFRMARWGVLLPPKGLFRRKPGGYTACLAGHTLLASGYKLTGQDHYMRGREHVIMEDIPVLAYELLGLTRAEYEHRYEHHGHVDCTLFCGAASGLQAVSAFSGLIKASRGELTRAA